jgi:thioredoxin reductase
MNRRGTLIAVTAISVVAAIFFLASGRAYSPGPLSSDHAPFEGNCAACHQPWHPLDNSGCVTCHGDYVPANPHNSVKFSGEKPDLIAGKVIRIFEDSKTHTETMSCLSCHSDHRGRKSDLAIAAATNCTFCHQHPSIENTTGHGGASILRPYGSHRASASPFSHKQELEVLKTRDHSIRSLPCQSCHQLEKTGPDEPETFVLLRSGLNVGDGSAVPSQTSPVAAGPAPATSSPQVVDEYAKIWESVPATTTEIPIFTTVFHIGASSFRHSAAHLGYKCESCHEQMKNSTSAGDRSARMVDQCFECHSKTPPENPTVASARPQGSLCMLDVSTAFAQTAPSRQKPPQYKTCGECHNFHLNGKTQTNDFPHAALKVRPGSAHGITLAAYTIDLAPLRNASTSRLVPARIGLVPLLGLLAIALCSLGGIGLIRWFSPRDATPDTAAPIVTPDVAYHTESFETNIERLYVVGEVAGIGSINLAIRSGRQAVDAIASKIRLSNLSKEDNVFHVAIVGCGPAGLGAATTAKVEALSHLILERMTPASSIRDYPREKFLQASPIEIREYGGEFVMETDNTKESLIAEWEKAITRTGIRIHERSEVIAIERAHNLFKVKTAAGEVFKSHFVVVAVGAHGSPNHLNVPGETPDRVFYKLIEPDEYQNKRILVVGGGNAGAEIAQSLANERLQNQVSYSFREPSLSRPSRENVEKIAILQKQGRLTIYPHSQVKEINPGKVILIPSAAKLDGSIAYASRIEKELEIENDFVFAMLGASPPPFIKSLGIRMIKRGLRH